MTKTKPKAKPGAYETGPRLTSLTEKERKLEHYKPLDDRVIVLADESMTASQGGILLPDTVQEKPQYGTVLRVGPGKLTKDGKREPLEVNVNDKVMFSRYAGTEVPGVERCFIMRADDILAVVED
jgi:chaperonin GroES